MTVPSTFYQGRCCLWDVCIHSPHPKSGLHQPSASNCRVFWSLLISIDNLTVSTILLLPLCISSFGSSFQWSPQVEQAFQTPLYISSHPDPPRSQTAVCHWGRCFWGGGSHAVPALGHQPKTPPTFFLCKWSSVQLNYDICNCEMLVADIGEFITICLVCIQNKVTRHASSSTSPSISTPVVTHLPGRAFVRR